MTKILVSIIQIIGGIIESLLFFRFLFLLFNAAQIGLVGSLLNFTEVLVRPFNFIPQITSGSYVIDFSIVAAMLAYVIIWYLLVELVLLIGNSLSKK